MGKSEDSLSIRELAKRGRYEELMRRIQAGEPLELVSVFERAVTDFRSVRRNEGHARILSYCIEAGLDLDASGDWLGQSVVSMAAMYGNNAAVGQMQARGLPQNPFSRSSVGDVEYLRLLATRSELSELRDRNGFNPLFYVASSALGKADEGTYGRLEMACALLMEKGVDASLVVENELRLSPVLMCAWFGGHEGVLDRLLAVASLDAEQIAQAVEFCLEPHQRSGEPHFTLAARILAAGSTHGFAINDRRASQGRTLLHGAANRGSLRAVEWLLDSGADPNARDEQGATALHVAADRNSSARVARSLLEAGADPRALDGEGRSALQRARAKKRERVAEFLAQR